MVHLININLSLLTWRGENGFHSFLGNVIKIKLSYRHTDASDIKLKEVTNKVLIVYFYGRYGVGMGE